MAKRPKKYNECVWTMAMLLKSFQLIWQKQKGTSVAQQDMHTVLMFLTESLELEGQARDQKRLRKEADEAIKVA